MISGACQWVQWDNSHQGKQQECLLHLEAQLGRSGNLKQRLDRKVKKIQEEEENID